MVDLSTDPNAHSKPLRITITESSFGVSGYHDFILQRSLSSLALYPSEPGRLSSRFNRLYPYLQNVDGKTFLDLGCNAGFWSLRAALNGAEVTAVDMDPHVSIALDLAACWIGVESPEVMERISVFTDHIPTLIHPHDVVCALAIIHWLYDCTAEVGSLEGIVGYLAGHANKVLIVEWIAAEDENIKEYKHLGDPVPKEWTEENFVGYLEGYFKTVTRLGEASPHRVIYLAEDKR